MSSLHFGTLMIISIMQIGSIRGKKILSIDNKDRYTDVELHVFINLNKGKKTTYEMFSTTNIK